jgi:hypothetical protein
MKSLNKFVFDVAVVVKDDGYIHSSIAVDEEGDTTSMFIYLLDKFFFFFSKSSNQSYSINILDSIDGLSRRVEK